jgi:hypothetical protein
VFFSLNGSFLPVKAKISAMNKKQVIIRVQKVTAKHPTKSKRIFCLIAACFIVLEMSIFGDKDQTSRSSVQN